MRGSILFCFSNFVILLSRDILLFSCLRNQLFCTIGDYQETFIIISDEYLSAQIS